MATIALGAAAVLGSGLAVRAGLRSAAKNGAKLSPLMQAIAGSSAAGSSSANAMKNKFGKAPNGQEWIVGGFNQKMDRREASSILGLR
jgi:DnaJ family protein C protein 19